MIDREEYNMPEEIIPRTVQVENEGCLFYSGQQRMY
jgi:hypothetical protein